VTAAEPFERQAQSTEKGVKLKALDSVLGTAGRKTAAGLRTEHGQQERRYQALIAAQQSDQTPPPNRAEAG